MTLLYADTSALVRAYFVDEADHALLRGVLLEGPDAVVASELARLEFASAAIAAARAGRLDQPEIVLAGFDADCGPSGPLALIRLDVERTLPEALRLLRAHPLRTLDALHLAAALLHLPELADGDDVGLVTRDRDQARAAEAEGLRLVG